MTEVQIRWLIFRDFDEVLTIEHDSFPYPWSLDDFLRCLRSRNCIGMVAEARGQVLGYMIYGSHRAHLELLNFAVHPDRRREGIGSRMVLKIQEKLSAQRRQMVAIEIREQNTAALLFFRHHGFRAVAIQRAPYDEDDEDGITMEYRLPLDEFDDGVIQDRAAMVRGWRTAD